MLQRLHRHRVIDKSELQIDSQQSSFRIGGGRNDFTSTCRTKPHRLDRSRKWWRQQSMTIHRKPRSPSPGPPAKSPRARRSTKKFSRLGPTRILFLDHENMGKLTTCQTRAPLRNQRNFHALPWKSQSQIKPDQLACREFEPLKYSQNASWGHVLTYNILAAYFKQFENPNAVESWRGLATAGLFHPSQVV